MNTNGNGEYRVSYVSKSGSSSVVGIGMMNEDGHLQVFLTRDFPPTEIQKGARKGDLQYRVFVSRVNGDEERDDSPILESLEDERLVIRGDVAGLENQPYFGAAFVNAPSKKAGPSLSLVMETLPVATPGGKGHRRALDIRSEAKPEKKSDGAEQKDDVPF